MTICAPFSKNSTRRPRDDLRRVLIHDQADRDAIAAQLLRYRDGHVDDGGPASSTC
jgi:hypothetical protein